MSEVAEHLVRTSARLAQGESGGGFFVTARDGAPRLLGQVIEKCQYRNAPIDEAIVIGGAASRRGM